jgi:hypothetical protein
MNAPSRLLDCSSRTRDVGNRDKLRDAGVEAASFAAKCVISGAKQAPVATRKNVSIVSAAAHRF